jgi:Fe2+ or Zn2+ uptake regulation protein
VADVHDTAARRLQAAGQRYTSGRQAVVDVLAQARAPLTIPEVVAGGRHIPQSSAYRSLAVLEQAGVVRRLLTSGDFARYELAEDLTEHHHHLICSSCGTVDDFTASRRFEQTVAKAVAEIARDTGFDAHHHRIDLIGVCNRCA